MDEPLTFEQAVRRAVLMNRVRRTILHRRGLHRIIASRYP